MLYDTTQPRVAVVSPLCSETYEQRTRELGQAATMGEAMFWCSIGYRVEVSRWNGRCYESSENYLPEDLQ